LRWLGGGVGSEFSLCRAPFGIVGTFAGVLVGGDGARCCCWRGPGRGPGPGDKIRTWVFTSGDAGYFSAAATADVVLGFKLDIKY